MKHTVTCMCDYRRCFGLDIGFINQFNTQLVITINYSAIVDFHTLPNHAKSLQARNVFTSSCLVTGSNNNYSSVSVLKFSPNGGSLPTELFLLQLSLCTDRVENAVFYITSIVACVSIAAGTCLRSGCL
jgi:hypothetical protein